MNFLEGIFFWQIVFAIIFKAKFFFWKYFLRQNYFLANFFGGAKICSRWSKGPIFKVWLKSCQEQLRYNRHGVCVGGVVCTVIFVSNLQLQLGWGFDVVELGFWQLMKIVNSKFAICNCENCKLSNWNVYNLVIYYLSHYQRLPSSDTHGVLQCQRWTLSDVWLQCWDAWRLDQDIASCGHYLPLWACPWC